MSNLERALRRKNDRRTKNAAHMLVADTAEALAFAAYEVLMKDDFFYGEWKALNPDLSGEALQKEWVRTRIGWFLEEARATLGKCLASESLDAGQKEQIFEALTLDATLLSNEAVANPTKAVGQVWKN